MVGRMVAKWSATAIARVRLGMRSQFCAHLTFIQFCLVFRVWHLRSCTLCFIGDVDLMNADALTSGRGMALDRRP